MTQTSEKKNNTKNNDVIITVFNHNECKLNKIIANLDCQSFVIITIN